MFTETLYDYLIILLIILLCLIYSEKFATFKYYSMFMISSTLVLQVGV